MTYTTDALTLTTTNKVSNDTADSAAVVLGAIEERDRLYR